MKIVHKESFVIGLDDINALHQAEVYRSMLESRGCDVIVTTNNSDIIVSGKRLICDDEKSTQL